MSNLQTDTFWHRLAAQVAFTASLLTVLFFVLTNFLDIQSIDMTLRIGALPALLAGITMLLAVGNFLPLPNKPALTLLTQGFLAATVAALIYTTGGLFSPYLALWVPAALFAGVYGIASIALHAALAIGYAAWLATTDILTVSMTLMVFFIGIVPLVLSYLIFSRSEADTLEDNGTRYSGHMRHMSDRAEIVITAITNGVIALDKDGIIQLINPAAQRLIGWNSSDAIKLDYKSVLKLEDAQANELTAATDPIRNVLYTNKELRTDDIKLVTRSGKKLDISLVVNPVGQPGSGVIVVFSDITKEKAEERDQAEFISTASHEMRTPVASIEGYLGLALNPATAQIDDKARMYITKAHEVAQHLGRLFQDLLDITKAEDGRLSNNPKAVEVVTFVKDVVEGLRPQAEAKGLILLYKPIPDDELDEKAGRRLNPVFYANVDNDHLREVVSNLVENAIKYTKQGTVSVDIGGDEKQVLISVQDTGIGIPSEDVPHLFQKFYRVDNSDTREIGGTGLGLYLSRRLAEAMEGRIWAESRHGQGSTFFVSIPRISHQEAMQLIETVDEPASSAQTLSPAIDMTPLPPTPQQAPPAFQATNGGPTENPAMFAGPHPNTAPTQASQQPPAVAPNPHLGPAAPVNSGPQGPSLETIEQNPQHYLQRDGSTNQNQT